MSPTSSMTISIAVTPDIKAAFEGYRLKGSGGFQALSRRIAEQIEGGTPVLQFSAEEFRRVVKYATTYGEGGFQSRLRIIIAQWTAQHFEELVG